MTATITPRLHRTTIRRGGPIYGLAKFEFTRRTAAGFTLFEVIHDGATRTTTLRTYPGCASTVGHAFTVKGLHMDDVRRLVFRRRA
jgi:hypothetical protein